MVVCYLLHPDTLGTPGLAVLMHYPAPRRSVAIALDAPGAIPVDDAEAVLRAHFAGKPPDWAGFDFSRLPGYAPADCVLPENHITEAADALQQAPGSAAMQHGQFSAPGWAWNAVAHRRGDPAARPVDLHPLKYAGAAGGSERAAMTLLCQRNHPAAWLPALSSMLDAVAAARVTDLSG